ncbi:MAG: EAL domain-containing protein, partial [Oscillospiraceae bacterium]|nr:EAL domain-containing protein [Oscillospiraceae bacterium]
MTIIYFDICAVVILVILLISVFTRKMTNGTVNRIFMSIVIVSIIAGIFDIFAVALDNLAGRIEYCAPARYISNTGYLIFHNISPMLYLVYLIGLADTWHKFKKSRAIITAVSIAYGILLILFAVNPVTKLMFYFDEEHRYKRGPIFPLLYVYAFFFMLSAAFYLMKYKKLFTAEKFYALLSMLLLEVFAVGIQWLNPHLLVEMFANAIGVLYVMIAVQRPEEIIDSVTGLRKHGAYAVDMKRNFINEKHVSVVLVNISNFMSLYGMLNYDGINELLQMVAKRLVTINKELKAHAELYYLDRGRFRFVISESRRDLLEISADKINSALKECVMINRLELNLIAYVCTAHCPEEIGDFATLMAFGSDFHDKAPFSGRVLTVTELTEKNAFMLTNELDKIIDNAIATGKFQVYYQPIYSVQEQKFVSAEALLRLWDDKYGFISPDLFITAAEKSGAIHKIGDFVFEEVCKFISSPRFSELGLEYIEINLSVAQCMQTDLADKILQIMRKYNVSADKINLEITETATNYSQNIMTANIDKLSDAGISFSLDDYGTGYSNIRSVASLPLKIVKLDKSFADVEDNPKMLIVLQDTIKMLKDMNMH